ncbi:MAG: hypothetical protein V9G29_19390 [Burkholderiaceae bacterium]
MSVSTAYPQEQAQPAINWGSIHAKPTLPARLRRSAEHIRGNFPAQVLGNLNELAWHFDAKRGAVTMAVQFSVAFLEALGQILAQVLDDGQAAIHSPLGRLHVDIAFADHPQPKRTQQHDILATHYGQMPVPGAALLLLGNRDKDPPGQMRPDGTNEAPQVLAGLFISR